MGGAGWEDRKWESELHTAVTRYCLCLFGHNVEIDRPSIVMSEMRGFSHTRHLATSMSVCCTIAVCNIVDGVALLCIDVNFENIEFNTKLHL